MLLKSITLQNFLSFGPSSAAFELRNLNVLIGPNGSGKSNLLDAIELLASLPKDFQMQLRKGGDVHNWIYKAEPRDGKQAFLGVEIANKKPYDDLFYQIGFEDNSYDARIVEERIENFHPFEGHTKPYIHYAFNNGKPMLNTRNAEEKRLSDLDLNQSILAQRRDPEAFPALTYLADTFTQIRSYREWHFGRAAQLRRSQSTAQPNDFLLPDMSNLGLILNKIDGNPKTKPLLIRFLKKLYDGLQGVHISIEPGSVRLSLLEEDVSIPAIRLSDGTLRYLSLLAILLHPTPPPLVCLEEPEIGLHPDMMPTIAELLKLYAERAQLIVTTHSDLLIDALSDVPEAVVVCEKTEAGTQMKRLAAEELAPFLEDYRLGQYWLTGAVGGTRW